VALRAVDEQEGLETKSCATLESDPWVYRLVVGLLGAVTLIGMIGALYLAGTGKEAPQVVVALGSGAIGALTGVLAPSPTRKR
jgi:hypothetical protein